MTALIVVGCVLTAFLLIAMLRLGVRAEYSDEGLFLKIKAGPIWVQILPQTKKEKKPKAAKQPAERGTQEKPKRNVKDTLSIAKQFIPLLGDAAGRFKRKLRIDYLQLHVIWGAADPAAAAMGFGAGHAAMGILWPAFAHNFRVKEHDLRVDVDFQRESPTLTAKLQTTLAIGQCLTLGLRLGWKALKIYLGMRREQTEQKAVQV